MTSHTCKYHGHYITAVASADGWAATIEDSFGETRATCTAETHDEVIELARQMIDAVRATPTAITEADVESAIAELDALRRRRAEKN